MIPTIVLDLDDTLYLEESYIDSGLAWVSAWLERELGLRGFQAEASALRKQGVRDHLFDRALTRLGVVPQPALIGDLVEQYRSHPPSISLAPDAEAFLAADHDCSFALITDGFAVAQRAKIAALGLYRFAIDPMICTDEWGASYWKPHLRAFKAIEAARPDGSDIFVYVADNPAKDFLAPRKLGWSTVQIDRPGAIHSRVPPSPGHRADRHIRSFDELTLSWIQGVSPRSVSIA